MQIVIKPLSEENIDRVCELEESSFAMPWKKKDFEELIESDKSSYLVIEADGLTVGAAGYTDQVGEGYINNVVIDGSFRRQGLGKRLMEAVIEDARNHGITDLTLEVRVSNEAAFKLYESVGFESVGVRKGFYDMPKEDAYVMWKH